MDRKTVRKHLEIGIAAPAYGPRPAQPRLIEPFQDYLRARVAAWPELSGRRLLRELKERGYQGCYSDTMPIAADAPLDGQHRTLGNTAAGATASDRRRRRRGSGGGLP